MRNCGDIGQSLGAWLDGELSGAEAEAVRQHVEQCAACKEERRQLEKLEVALRNVLESEASRIAFEPFWRSVHQRATERRKWRENFRYWLRVAFAGPGIAWAIPAVILLLIGVLSADSFVRRLRLFGPRNNFASVESIDAYGRNVALLREDETKTTVIWLYQNQEGEDDSSDEAPEAKPSF
jgi:anti-sigma factor RsiW